MNRFMAKNHLLKTKIMEWYPKEGRYQTSIADFEIVRRDEPSTFSRYLYKPMVIVQLQGSKYAVLGSGEYVCKEHQYMVSTVTVSAASRVTEATPQNPYISLCLNLDLRRIVQLLAANEGINEDIKDERETIRCGDDASQESERLWFIADTDLLLLDAFLRLSLLLEQPQNKQKVLADIIKKEIHYLLLTGPVGAHIRAIATKGTQYNKIAEAMNFLQQHYKEKLYIENLAEEFGMAPSSFFRHFRKVTTLSPLQYQKQLKLLEAQRLMLLEGLDAQAACYKVGYESATQFSREYKNLFGEPPKQNVKKLGK